MSDITQSQKTALLKIPGFKDIQKQYAKENKMTGAGKKRRMKGRGFWDDVGNWFNQAGQDINQFLKDSKIVSNVAAYALPILGAMGGALLTVNPLGATAGGIAGKSAADYIRSQGYGYVNNLSKIGTKRMSGSGPYDALMMFAPLAASSLNYLDATQKRLKGSVGMGMHTGMMGKGPIYSQNGMLVAQPKQSGGGHCGCGMKGGATTQYNTVSTEFSEVKFR